MIEAVNLYVFILGIACLIVPFLAGLYFWRDREGVGRKISWMFFAESNAIAITLMFSYQSVDHGYNAMPPIESAILRALLFIPQVLSTAALVHYLLDQIRDGRG